MAAAAVVAAVELAGDDVAVVVVAGVILRRGVEQPPVLFVDLDDGLAEVVDLVGAAQRLEASSGGIEVRANPERGVLRGQGQLAEPGGGLLAVACRLGRQATLPRPGRS